jgi:hypothetical protein
LGVLERDLGVLERDLGVLDRDLGVLERDLGVVERDLRDLGVLERDFDLSFGLGDLTLSRVELVGLMDIDLMQRLGDLLGDLLLSLELDELDLDFPLLRDTLQIKNKEK